MSTYEEACKYISEIPRFAAKTELKNTRILLEALDNPQVKYRNLHVAGTNGKGSVCRMLSLMLQKAGYKTGLFISPHLIRMNERISVNGTDISDDDFLLEFMKVKNTSKELLSGEAGSIPPSDDGGFAHPAYFEFLFAMAADYFAKQGCDYVVWETGLGGRLDATNTVVPKVSVITSVGLDHMQYLGSTVKEIAGEKAGIIKPGVPVIYNTGNEEADRVIEAKARELGSRAVRVFDARTGFPEEISDVIGTFAASTPAAYQRDNAETAVAAILETKVLSGENADVISKALSSFFWPGRMQFIEDGVVIDGAHNEDAAKRFAESVNNLLQNGSRRKVSLLFAVSSDKDYEDIIRILCEGLPLKDIYVSEINSDRRTDPEGILKLFEKYCPADGKRKLYGSHDLKKTFHLARSERDEDTLLAAVGSLYMVGEILDFIAHPAT
ncbi:MAG: bifunctional folylpolyglutamate synthase/dihydrofolate synthase [Lachnospiraceae bacterium]|nr:bifunctional folylpolyglutamate synthase/dihydrofolate synthase [Lachnospiraceae bacterium]